MATIVYLARGNAVAAQTTPGVAAAIGANNWMNWSTKFTIKDAIKNESPEFLTYQIWAEKQDVPLTQMVEWQMDFLVDTWQWGWFLMSFDGAPTGGGPYLFTPGKNAGKLLTLVKVNRNLTTYRVFKDAIVTDLTCFDYGPTKVITGSAKGYAILAAPAGSPPTPAPVAVTDKSPVKGKWGVFTINGAPVSVETAKLDLSQTVAPFYDSPGAGAAGGVDPSVWQVDAMTARFALTRKYLADAGSDLAQYRGDLANAGNTALMFDPANPTKGFTLTVPTMKALDGEEDDSHALSIQKSTQNFLYDSATGGGMTIALLGEAGYATS